MNALVTEFDALHRVRLAYRGFRWGMEGEQTFCFRLSELSSEAATAFVKRLRVIASEGESVSLDENAPCNDRNVRSRFSRP